MFVLCGAAWHLATAAKRRAGYNIFPYSMLCYLSSPVAEKNKGLNEKWWEDQHFQRTDGLGLMAALL